MGDNPVQAPANLSEIFEIGGKRIWDLALIPDGKGGYTENPRSISYPKGTKAVFLTSSFDGQSKMLMIRNSAGEVAVICGDTANWDDTNLFLNGGVVFLMERDFSFEEGFYRDSKDGRTFRIRAAQQYLEDERISVSPSPEVEYAIVQFGNTFSVAENDYGVRIRRYEAVDHDSPTWFAIFAVGTELNTDRSLENETCFIFPFSDLLAAKEALCRP